MGGASILILLAVIVAAALTISDMGKRMGFAGLSSISDLIDYIKTILSGTKVFNRFAKSQQKLDMNILNCRVAPASVLQEGAFVDVFSVDICGLIRSSSQGQKITVKISILDITEGTCRAKTVNAKVKEYQLPDSQEFSYSADLGRIPNSHAVLNDWTNIAQLRIDHLIFAHKGKRQLQFAVKVLAGSTGQDIASAISDCTYDNPDFGYVDMQENLRQTKTLTVATAFAVSAAGGSLSEGQVELIRKWAKDHLDVSETTDEGLNKLEAALDETLAFFRAGHQLNIPDICHRLVKIAPPARRYDVLELAMKAAVVKKSVDAGQMNIFAELADMLELDGERVRAMTDKIIPLGSREVQDAEVVLGVTSEMSREKAREYLNREYAKWNARVTNCDPQIQTQADQMLKLIAEARDRYVQKTTV